MEAAAEWAAEGGRRGERARVHGPSGRAAVASCPAACSASRRKQPLSRSASSPGSATWSAAPPPWLLRRDDRSMNETKPVMNHRRTSDDRSGRFDCSSSLVCATRARSALSSLMRAGRSPPMPSPERATRKAARYPPDQTDAAQHSSALRPRGPNDRLSSRPRPRSDSGSRVLPSLHRQAHSSLHIRTLGPHGPAGRCHDSVTAALARAVHASGRARCPARFGVEAAGGDRRCALSAMCGVLGPPRGEEEAPPLYRAFARPRYITLIPHSSVCLSSLFLSYLSHLLASYPPTLLPTPPSHLRFPLPPPPPHLAAPTHPRLHDACPPPPPPRRRNRVRFPPRPRFGQRRRPPRRRRSRRRRPRGPHRAQRLARRRARAARGRARGLHPGHLHWRVVVVVQVVDLGVGHQASQVFQVLGQGDRWLQRRLRRQLVPFALSQGGEEK